MAKAIKTEHMTTISYTMRHGERIITRTARLPLDEDEFHKWLMWAEKSVYLIGRPKTIKLVRLYFDIGLKEAVYFVDAAL